MQYLFQTNAIGSQQTQSINNSGPLTRGPNGEDSLQKIFLKAI